MAIRYTFLGKSLTTSLQTALLTAPTEQQIIIKTFLYTNTTSNTPTITLDVTDDSESVTVRYKTAVTIAANATVDILSTTTGGNVLVLDSGDILKATVSSSDKIDFLISYMLVSSV